jgi:two-component system, sensor histidine kinase LadS
MLDCEMKNNTVGFLNLFAVLFVLLLVVAITMVTKTTQGDLVTKRAYFEDPTSKMVFEDIQQLPFAPYDGVFSQGYSASNFWFRLSIDSSRAHSHNPLESTDKVVLRIRPPYLREVEFFDPANPTDHRRLSGDLYSSSSDEYRSLNLSFVLPAGEMPRDVYVRMATSSSTLVKFDAYSMEEVGAVDFRQGVFFTLYLSFLLLSLLLGLFLLTISRSSLVMMFVLRQGSAILWAVAIYGIYRYIDFGHGPKAVDFMVSSVLLVTIVSEAFDFLLFRSFKVPRMFSRIQLTLIVFPLLGCVLYFVGEIRVAMIMTLSSALCYSVVTMISCYFIPPSRSGEIAAYPLPKWSVALSYTVICGFLLMTLVPQLGFYVGAEFAMYSIAFHTALSTTLVSLIIFRRARLIHEEKLLLSNQLASAQSAMQVEKAAREDQSALLAMLSHELKTPLATMTMALGALPKPEPLSGRIHAAIGEMNDLIDRCLYTGKIEEGVIFPNKSSVDISEVLRERLVAVGSPSRIEVNIENGLVIQTDPQFLGIILANLIDNACKYSAQGTHIKLVSEVLEIGGVAITVSNVPRLGRWPDATRLFRKYYRADTSHNVIGSGLGLFLSQRLAEHLGGSIAYEPTETEVRFKLWLPV